MTIEQIKEEAKKRLDREITDEQAQAWLDAHPAGELSDEELENVAGGGCGGPTYPDWICKSCGDVRCGFASKEQATEAHNRKCPNCRRPNLVEVSTLSARELHRLNPGRYGRLR